MSPAIGQQYRVTHMLLRLHTKTLELIDNRPRRLTYEVIAQATGLEKEWIRKFVHRKNKDPGVNRVEKLYTFLANKELEL